MTFHKLVYVSGKISKTENLITPAWFNLTLFNKGELLHINGNMFNVVDSSITCIPILHLLPVGYVASGITNFLMPLLPHH